MLQVGCTEVARWFLLPSIAAGARVSCVEKGIGGAAIEDMRCGKVDQRCYNDGQSRSQGGRHRCCNELFLQPSNVDAATRFLSSRAASVPTTSYMCRAHAREMGMHGGRVLCMEELVM